MGVDYHTTILEVRADPMASNKKRLTVQVLQEQAVVFGRQESRHDERRIFGVDNGKTIGTYFEKKFQRFLSESFTYEVGSAAKGIDFPELDVDMKTTSIRQPQSSCPFKNARQKIYGLGYSVLLFVYEKTDDRSKRTARLNYCTPSSSRSGELPITK
jgi:hypothetical protein